MNEDIPVYISAEDSVTKAVIERLLAYTSPRLKVFKNIPARGGEIKSKIVELNTLSAIKPVVALIDLDDNGCAPALKKELMRGATPKVDFLLNIAIDEAEAWLMADKKGFASYFGLSANLIPDATMQKLGGMVQVQEMDFGMKSSWILTHEMMPQSTNAELKAQMVAEGTAAKGKEYNPAIIPFIKDYWNIDTAAANSDSLRRMIKRLRELVERY